MLHTKPPRISSHLSLALDPRDEHLDSLETPGLILQYKCYRYATSLAPHTLLQSKLWKSEVWTKLSEWVTWAKIVCLGFIWKQKSSKYCETRASNNLHQFILGSIGEHEVVSHPESEVRKESSEIILMHTCVHDPQTFLDPQESISTPFARDQQSLGVGVCWRSILMFFTANIPSNFMLLELYYYNFY